MAYIKTPHEIALMTEAGKRLHAVTERLIPAIKSGMTTRAVDDLAQSLLRLEGLGISFQTVNGYEFATCTAVNEQAVHTKPSGYVLRPGDVLTLDIGGIYEGYHSDWATTIIVDHIHDVRKEKFLAAGQRALKETLAHLGPGVHLGMVGMIMQQEIEGAGYQVLRELTGHGIGRELHEDPYIPNVVTKPMHKTYQIQPGFVCAIEIIYSESTTHLVQTNPDGWSIDTADGSLAACFEETIVVTQNGIHILT